MQLVERIDFGCETRSYGDESVSAKDQTSELGPDRGVIESKQGLALFDEITFVDQHLSDDPAFEVLDLLVLSGGNERTRGHNGTVKGRQASPGTEPDPP
jgi:hypothetical protein